MCDVITRFWEPVAGPGAARFRQDSRVGVFGEANPSPEIAQMSPGNWNESEQMDVYLDACVIMPNHVHGDLLLVEAGFKPASTANVRQLLPEIIQTCF